MRRPLAARSRTAGAAQVPSPALHDAAIPLILLLRLRSANPKPRRAAPSPTRTPGVETAAPSGNQSDPFRAPLNPSIRHAETRRLPSVIRTVAPTPCRSFLSHLRSHSLRPCSVRQESFARVSGIRKTNDHFRALRRFLRRGQSAATGPAIHRSSSQCPAPDQIPRDSKCRSGSFARSGRHPATTSPSP